MSTSEPERVYPIRIQLRNGITRQHIYDINGSLLVDELEKPLNIWNPNIKTAFESKRLRLIHSVKYGLHYFITSEQDLAVFEYERKHGSRFFRKTYHCYYDEDFDPLLLQRLNIEIVPPF